MKALVPVSVAGIEFDALMDESRTLPATVTEYPVEEGFSVSDAIILGPETMSMTLFVTDTPVTWAKRHGTAPGRVQQICKKLEEIYFAGSPVTVVTSEATYTNMAIENITFSKSVDVGYAREIPVSFKKIRTTKTKTTTIPESYLKSGATKAAAGTANSTTKGEKTSGKSSKKGDGKQKSSSKKSSIAYNLSKNAKQTAKNAFYDYR